MSDVNENTISVEVFELVGEHGDQIKNVSQLADVIEVTATRPYGCVVVRVDKDSIWVESQNGDGEAIEKTKLRIDSLVGDGKASMTLDELLAEAKKDLGDAQHFTQEAGIGSQPSPVKDEPEGQEAGDQEEGSEEAGDGGRTPKED